ncbi:hypothetical protein ABZ915_05630 [Streptomyces sp. NPDC046915]|uniref:hypothetical protein n=1 Tax=Streptomyces sp. NPDC046915 TaxID=3155257 RepID=UPI0033F8F936
MRLRTTLPLGLAAAAAVVLGPVGPAHGREAGLDCAGSEGRDFPLGARIRGGPTSYEAGGGFGTWYIDLTNTTDRACTAVHPVVVLVDEKRALKPEQARMEFYDGSRAHPVQFESTDEDELVGAFDDGFPGFAVGPGKTVSVKVRLMVTSDAVPNEVTAKAAVVERRGDDGEWLGESGDYRFGIDTEPAPEPPAGTTSAATPGPALTSTATPPPALTPIPGLVVSPSASPSSSTSSSTSSSLSSASSPSPSRSPSPSLASPPPAPLSDLPFADELARTGLGTPYGALAATAVLLVVGGVLLLTRRRR